MASVGMLHRTQTKCFVNTLDLEIETVVTDFNNIIPQKPIFVTDL